jgi:hypothetical protein
MSGETLGMEPYIGLTGKEKLTRAIEVWPLDSEQRRLLGNLENIDDERAGEVADLLIEAENSLRRLHESLNRKE